MEELMPVEFNWEVNEVIPDIVKIIKQKRITTDAKAFVATRLAKAETVGEYTFFNNLYTQLL